MNSVAETIIRDGIMIPFNAKGERIPMNKESEKFPFLTQIPDYLLIIAPDVTEFDSFTYANRELSSFDISRKFIDEWMPVVKRNNVFYRISNIHIRCNGRVSVVSSTSRLVEIANSGRKLSLYIYKRVAFECSDFVGKMSFEPIKPYDSIVKNIQCWLRGLLGLPTIYYTDIASLYPQVDESVYKGGYRFTNRHYGSYISHDIDAMIGAFKKYKEYKEKNMKLPKIEKVIFNDPATIVFWADGTKTVVKNTDKKKFDPEKGLAMAITKKALGNEGNYYNELRKWLPEE